MERYKIYSVAGHVFHICGETLCHASERMPGMRFFETEYGSPLFSVMESDEIPAAVDVLYESDIEGVKSIFAKTKGGFILEQKPTEGEPLYMWIKENGNTVFIKGNANARMFRFALWMGYGMMTLKHNTIAIHSSSIVYKKKAVLFLGESGTGKSTHTQLWRKHIDCCELLNDDSPIIRAEGNKVWVYGSPWSGKTHCYKNKRFELKGCVRLSQSPYNEITKLSTLKAYGAIHPSCPPEFAYDPRLYDYVSSTIDKLLSSASFYHLKCLPDKDAALLSCKQLFSDQL